MWQTKYALALPKTLGVGVNFIGHAVKAISSLGVRSPCQKQFNKMDRHKIVHTSTFFDRSKVSVALRK